MNKTLHTKWGTAKVSEGYYRITSKKEGNHNKFLHRLIWEDFYNCKVPEGYVIHHRNHIKTDNCILNLQLMRNKDHCILHNPKGENHRNYGKTHSGESKMKMSEEKMGHDVSGETKRKISESLSKSNNTSGYFRVCKQKDKRCNHGWRWAYWYYDENGKRKNISSNDIDKLEAKVKAKGLKWKKLKGDE